MAEMNRAAEERVQAEKDAEKAETAVESARQNVDSAQLRQEQQQKALPGAARGDRRRSAVGQP